MFQSRFTARRACGVTRGTTLHKAAPSRAAGPTNRLVRCAASPPSQWAVGMLACLTTRRRFARPRCVWVLPMSMSRIILVNAATMPQCEEKEKREGESDCCQHLRIAGPGAFRRSLLDGHVAANYTFQMAVLSAQQQGAIGIE